MRFTPYSEYIQPDSDWLGEVPASWNSIALGRLFRRVKHTGFENEELLSVYRDYGVIPKNSRGDNFNKPSDDLSPYQLVKPRQLVMNKMKAWQGSIAISEHQGIVSPAYFVYDPWKPHAGRMSPRYIHHLLRSPAYIAQYLRRSKGIRVNQWDLDPEAFERIEILLPTTEEQKQIAAFLDYETAKIDALIEKQQQLIALLGEKRQAVISHAVTKGLNPDAPMRDSGVEWLGEVPAHWAVSSLRYFATFFTGSTPDRSSAAYWNGDIPWVKTGEVKYERIVATEEYISQLGLNSSSCSIASAGTLLMALYGQGVTRGRVALLGVPAAFNQACVAINTDLRLNSEFLHAYFIFSYPYIRDGNETTQMNMNVEFVRRIPIVVPPIEEQVDITKAVETATLKFKELESLAKSMIDRLQERRTALISAAVTGKIDVRDWTPPTTDNATEVA